MASDEFVDITIANLKIIGMVGQNGKLRVRKGQLCLERDDRMQPVRRWASGDSRDLTLLHIRNAICNAMRITAMLAGADHGGSNNRRWTVARITAELSQCETGLQNLRTTYTTDSIMVANLGVIIERLAAHREAMASLHEQQTEVAVAGEQEQEQEQEAVKHDNYATTTGAKD